MRFSESVYWYDSVNQIHHRWGKRHSLVKFEMFQWNSFIVRCCLPRVVIRISKFQYSSWFCIGNHLLRKYFSSSKSGRNLLWAKVEWTHECISAKIKLRFHEIKRSFQIACWSFQLKNSFYVFQVLAPLPARRDHCAGKLVLMEPVYKVKSAMRIACEIH